jgi:hypothetical protein
MSGGVAKRRRETARRALLASVIAGMVFAPGATGAAVRVDGHSFGVLPAPGGKRLGSPRVAPGGARGLDGPVSGVEPPVTYHGGAVVHALRARSIYWEPEGLPIPVGFSAGFDTFMHDLGVEGESPGAVTSVAHEYVDPDGPALASLSVEAAMVDEDSLPAPGCAVEGEYVSCVTSEQIAEELGSLIGRGALAAGLDRSYAIVLPPGVRVCFDSGGSECSGEYFCGYHTVYYAPGDSEATTYTVIPFPGSGCQTGSGPHEASLDAATSIEAHELVETATDPEPFTGYVDASGNEVADECAWLWGRRARMPSAANSTR